MKQLYSENGDCLLGTIVMLAGRSCEEVNEKAGEVFYKKYPDLAPYFSWADALFRLWDYQAREIREFMFEVSRAYFGNRLKISVLSGFGYRELGLNVPPDARGNPLDGRGQVTVHFEDEGSHSMVYENGVVYNPDSSGLTGADLEKTIDSYSRMGMKVISVEVCPLAEEG